MKAVIVGGGSVGYNLARVLSQRMDILLLEQEEELCQLARDNLDVRVMCANGADVKALNRVITSETSIFIAVTGKDEVNLVACMAVKQLNKNVQTIARVSNPDYIDAPVSSRKFIGVDTMISPELSLATKMANVIAIPSAVDYEMVGKTNLDIMKFLVTPNSIASHTSLKDLKMPRNSLVVSIMRGDRSLAPKGEQVLEPSDKVLVVAKSDVIMEVASLFGPSKDTGDVFIVGGGIVGLYLANMLTSHHIKIIEQDKERCRELREKVPHHLIINANATDKDVLLSEGVDKAYALAAVTNSEEKNLLCALMGKQLGAKKVLARTAEFEHRDLFEMVGVDVAVSLHHVVINEMVKLLFGSYTKGLLTLMGCAKEVLKLPVLPTSKVASKYLKDLKFPQGVLIGAIMKGDSIDIPRGDSLLQEGDSVLVFSPPEHVIKVEKMFGCPHDRCVEGK